MYVFRSADLNCTCVPSCTRVHPKSKAVVGGYNLEQSQQTMKQRGSIDGLSNAKTGEMQREAREYQEVLVGDAVEEGRQDPSLGDEPPAQAHRSDGESRVRRRRRRDLRRRWRWRWRWLHRGPRRPLGNGEGAEARGAQEHGEAEAPHEQRQPNAPAATHWLAAGTGSGSLAGLLS